MQCTDHFSASGTGAAPRAAHPIPQVTAAWWRVFGLAPSTTSPTTHAAIIATSMLVVAAVSWGRLAVTGTLSQVGDQVITLRQWAWIATPASIALYLAGRSFVHIAYFGTADLGVRRIVVLGAIIHAASLPALPILSSDVFVNLATGRMVNVGLNPLIHSPADLPEDDPFRACVVTRWMHAVSPYGPLLMWLHAPAAATGSVAGGLIVFKAIFAATAALMIGFAAWYARRAGATPAARTGLALAAWNPISSSEFLGQLHSDVFAVAAALLFVCFARRERVWLATLALAAALYVKFVILPALGLYLVCVARRRPLQASAAAALVVAAGVVAYLPFWEGRGTFDGPLATLSTGRERLSGSPAMLIYETVRRWSDENAAAAWLNVWTFGVRVALIALAFRLARRVRTLSDVLEGAFVFTLCYLTFGSVWVMSWYAAWLLPWLTTTRNVGARRAGALFTALTPILYMPDAAETSLVVFTLVVYAVPWIAWWNSRSAERTAVAEMIDPQADGSDAADAPGHMSDCVGR